MNAYLQLLLWMGCSFIVGAGGYYGTHAYVLGSPYNWVSFTMAGLTSTATATAALLSKNPFNGK